MDLTLIVGMSVLFAVGVAAVWAKSQGSGKPKDQTRQVGHRREREEIHIDPNDVSEFKPTWRESR